MALYTELPPGLILDPKHSRSYFKSTRQTQKLLRAFPRNKIPRCPFPPATHTAIWGDWHVRQLRNLTRFILQKFNTGAAPMGKDWWTVFSGLLNPVNYKGVSKHYRTVQCWMWFYKLLANHAAANWMPFNPGYDFTQYPPQLPWDPPDPPEIDDVIAVAPLTLELYFHCYNLGYQFFPITYIRLRPPFPNPPKLFTEYQANTNAGWIMEGDEPIGCTLDLTPYPTIKPGTWARVGLRLFDAIHVQPSEITTQYVRFV